MPIAFNTEYLKIPSLNPFRWIKESNGLDDFFYNSISDEEGWSYHVPMQHGDAFNAQVQVKTVYLTSIKMELIDQYGNVKQTATAQLLYNDTSTGWSYYHFKITLSSSYSGQLFGLITVTLTDSSVETYVSEPMDLQADHEGTISIVYSHDKNEYDMVFQPTVIGLSSLAALNYTPNINVRYQLRIEGGLWTVDKSTASTDVIYLNNTRDPKIIHSVPYELFTYSFGSNMGIPFWVVDKLQRIFGCYFTAIDGVYYSKNEGANLENEGMKQWAFMTAKLQLVYKTNEYSNTYSKQILPVIPTGGLGSLEIGEDFQIGISLLT